MSTNHWAGVQFIQHNLGKLAARCGIDIDKGLQTSDFGMALTNAQWVYGAEDTRVTYECYNWMIHDAQNQCHPDNLGFSVLDCRYIHVAHMIRTTGMFVDTSELERARTQTAWYHQQQAAKWFDATGFTPTVSHIHLIPFLEARGHNVWIDDPKKRGQKKKSSNKAVLKEAAKTDPQVGLLLDCRASAKLLEFIMSMIGMAETHDGKAICGLKVLANQGLGRTSSSSLVRAKIPTTANLQNIPTENFEYPQLPNLRKCFIAPEGYTYVGVDLSAAHLRFAAFFSGCDSILSKMVDGEDVHCFNASLIVKGILGEDHPLANYETFRDIKMHKLSQQEWDRLHGEGWTSKELEDLVKHYRNIAKTAIYTAINFGGAKRLQAGLKGVGIIVTCLLYTSPSPRDLSTSRMPSSA